MWVIVVVAGLLLIAAIVNRMAARDRTPPLERHERALAALAELATQPRPSVPATPGAELPSGHIRILDSAPPASARKRTTRRPAAAKRRTPATRARTRRPNSTSPPPIEDPARPTIHIGFAEPIDEPTPDRAEPPTPVPAEPVVVAATSAAPAPPAATPLALGPTRRRRHLHPPATRAAVVAAVVVGGGALGMALAAGGNNGRGTGNTPRAVAPVTATVSTTLPPPTTPPVQLAAHVETLPTGDANVSVPGPFTLALHATGMCWVQVSGANGQTLFTGTLYPGQNQQVSGAAPLVVRLGNTPGMTLAVNGAALDLSGVAKTANVRFLS